jgi:nitronate monooxygenase
LIHRTSIRIAHGVPSASSAAILRNEAGHVAVHVFTLVAMVGYVRVVLVGEGQSMRTRFTDLLGVELPIVQAPMAGANDAQLAIAVCHAGGLGSLPCAMLDPPAARAELETIRAGTDRPVNLNFFCHAEPMVDDARHQQWRTTLSAYYAEFGLTVAEDPPSAGRSTFGDAQCEIVDALRPEVVSFHFGLPAASLVERVRATGARIMSSATTVDEARWLEAHGCDVIIAQGVEAGGHRGMFLSDDVSSQIGTMALVPQVVDAVNVPVIAAGGIADARGVAAALLLGADAVQIGTAYLRCPESTITDLHRDELQREGETVLTNVFTGRPARSRINRLVREVGPMSSVAPAFPLAVADIAPLRAKAESNASPDFSPLWSGQAAYLAPAMPAAALTRHLAEESARLLAAAGARFA